MAAGSARPEQPRRGCARPAPRTKEHEARGRPRQTPVSRVPPPRPHRAHLCTRTQQTSGMWCPPAPRVCRLPERTSRAAPLPCSTAFLGAAMDPTDKHGSQAGSQRPGLAQSQRSGGCRGTQALTCGLQQPGFISSQGRRLCRHRKSFLALVDALED